MTVVVSAPFVLSVVLLSGPKSKLLSELKGLGEILLHAEAHLVKVVNESSQVSRWCPTSPRSTLEVMSIISCPLLCHLPVSTH